MIRFRQAIDSHWAFLAIALTLAIALYVTTGNLVASVSLPYFVEAWPTARTAFWLQSHDPIRARAKTMFWFYLATATCRAAISSLSMLAIFIVFVAPLIRNRANPGAGSHILAALLIALALTVVLGTISTISATIRRVPVFVVSNLFNRCGGDFPSINPIVISRPHFNYAIFVVAIPILVAGLFLGVLIGYGMQSVAGLFIGPVLVIPIYGFVSNRIVAPTPVHCWPDLFLLRDAELQEMNTEFFN